MNRVLKEEKNPGHFLKPGYGEGLEGGCDAALWMLLKPIEGEEREEEEEEEKRQLDPNLFSRHSA